MVEIHGSILNGFNAAGQSIRLLLHRYSDEQLDYSPDKWYHLSDFQSLLQQSSCYNNPGAVLERIGEEMMRAWYQNGPGKQLAPTAVNFLRFQAGSQGYRSVVRGTSEEVGDFVLEKLDEQSGLARIRSSTIFDRHLELGILYGALSEAQGLLFFDVILNSDNEHIDIRFVTEENLTTLSWSKVLSESEWKLSHQLHQFERREKFWVSINDTLNQAFDEMRQKATLDTLTGICTRGEFLNRFQIDFERASRSGVPLSVLYLDIDKFKMINDAFGHTVGDLVIQAFVRACKFMVRMGDLFGRLGGEEFAIVLWNTALEDACHVAQKIVNQVKLLGVDTDNGKIRFTVSIGLAQLKSGESIQSLINRADQNLLLAKNTGRDRIYF